MKTRLAEIIEGLNIIHQVEPDADFSAEHDEIYCGDPEKYSVDQKVTLEELGWEEHEGFTFRHWA